MIIFFSKKRKIKKKEQTPLSIYLHGRRILDLRGLLLGEVGCRKGTLGRRWLVLPAAVMVEKRTKAGQERGRAMEVASVGHLLVG